MCAPSDEITVERPRKLSAARVIAFQQAFDPLSGSRPQEGGMNSVTSDTMKMGHHAFTRPQGSPCLMNSIPFIDRK